MCGEASPFTSRPYRRRTWIRRRLPWWLIDRGWAAWKPRDDCEAVGDRHEWHNVDDERSRCYHCGVIREGRWWTQP